MEHPKPYSPYRASGLAWLPEIPAHWDVRRVKTLLRERDERTLDGTGELLSLTRAHGIIPQSEASNRLASVADLTGYKRCERGDLVMNRMQAWSGMFGVSGLDGVISPDYSIFRARADANARYFAYLFRTPLLVDQFARLSKGIGSGFNRLYAEEFGSVHVAVPPLDEQATIVRFLDHADRRIRRAIRSKQKLIALLNEQKQVVIHRAVTRGLDPNVRLKPSGVDWLGDVPKHWEIWPLKRIGAVRMGLTYSPNDVSDENGTLVLRASNIRSGRVVHADNVYVSRDIPSALRVREGDILVCVRSGSRNLVGKSALITADFADVSYGAFMSLLRTYDNAFVYWILNSNLLPTLMAQFETSTINQLTQNDLKNIAVPFPPQVERSRITAFLTRATSKIGAATVAASDEISLLHEYRTRLIADVVTGKLDVREASARLQDEVDEPEPRDAIDVEESAEADVDDLEPVEA